MDLDKVVYVIGSLAHAELHLIEMSLKTGDLTQIINLLNVIRKARIDFGKKYVPETTWCIIKHLAIALVYLDEILERIGDEEEYKRITSIREIVKSITRQLIEKPIESEIVCVEAQECS